MQLSLVIKIVSLAVPVFVTASCSSTNKAVTNTKQAVVNTSSFATKTIYSGAAALKNTAANAAPGIFKRKQRYPQALPLRRVNTNTCPVCPAPTHHAAIQRTATSQPITQNRQPYALTAQRRQQQPPHVMLASGSTASPSPSAMTANSQLFRLAKTGNAAQIQQLINQGANPNSANANGETPLHAAASSGNMDAAMTLLQRGAYVNARTIRGWTPLHTAARYGSTNVTALLLKQGANPRVVNIDGKTPLMLAQQARQSATAALLSR